MNKRIEPFVLIVLFLFIFSCNNQPSSANDDSSKDIKEEINNLQTQTIQRNSELVNSLNGYWRSDEHIIFDKEIPVDYDESGIEKFKDNNILFFNEDTLYVSFQCVSKIQILKQSAINHFHSNSSVQLYKELLKDGFDLALNDSVFTISNYNGEMEECEYPFNDLLFVNDKIVLYDGGYLYAFSKIDDFSINDVIESNNSVEFPIEYEQIFNESLLQKELSYYHEKLGNLSEDNYLFYYPLLEYKDFKVCIIKRNYGDNLDYYLTVCDKNNIHLQKIGGFKILDFLEGDNNYEAESTRFIIDSGYQITVTQDRYILENENKRIVSSEEISYNIKNDGQIVKIK